jgi:hypothetical protein
VLLLGVPFQYTLGRVLRARLEFLRDTCAIDEADFLTFDAIRNVRIAYFLFNIIVHQDSALPAPAQIVDTRHERD